MDQLEQNVARFKVPAMAGTAGIAAALVVATLPHVYLENIIGATGLSEIVSAAAPPLGNTARGLIALMAGLVSASAIYFFLNRKGGSDMGVALREQINAANPVTEDYDAAAKAKAEKKRFSLPKLKTSSLTKFLKKPKKTKDQGESGADRQIMDLADLPKLRSADAHPDAPARRPIFAETDLGAPLPLEVPAGIRPFENAEPEQAAQQQVAQEQEMAAAPPLRFDMGALGSTQEQAKAQQPEPIAQPDHAADVEEQTYLANENLDGLSISQLTERLEAGLAHLKKLEVTTQSMATFIPEPLVAPAAPVQAPLQESVQQPAQTPVSAQQPAAEQAPPPLKEVAPSQEQIQATRQADMDAALKAALGTLEKMTAYR